MKHITKPFVSITMLILTFCLIFGLLGSLASHATAQQKSLLPLADAESLVVEFNSVEDAQKAALEPMPLPVGKTLALASRWDDTNGDHKLMTKTLHDNGWKGTFFLNQVNSDYAENVVRQMVADGSSVGAHTTSHPSLGLVVPNAMYHEILGNRIALETTLDLCVTTFTFPNGLSGNVADPESLDKMAEALRRAGILGMSEPSHVFDRLKMDPKEMVACYLFRADDRNPQLAVFEREFKAGLEQLKAGRLEYCGPFFVLGVHAWQRQSGPDGFERLSKILATQSNKPEYWYCNTNEYTAYRLCALNSEIVRADSKGGDQKAEAEFQIARPNPVVLGAAVELGVKITPAPKSVRWTNPIDGTSRALTVSDQGEIMLPALGELPSKIGLAKAANGFVSPKFEGLKLETKVDLKLNVLTCLVKNDTSYAIENPTLTFRLPLKWTKGLLTASLQSAAGKSTLAAGEQYQWTVPMNEFSSDPAFDDYLLYFATQLDFRYADGTKAETEQSAGQTAGQNAAGQTKAGRLYSETLVDQPAVDKAVPRDCAWFLGAVPGSSVTDDWLANCSQPETKLIPLGDQPVETWRKVSSNKKNVATALQSVQSDNGKAKNPAIVYALEFSTGANFDSESDSGSDSSSAAMDCVFKTSLTRQLKKAYLNGKPLDLSKNGEFSAAAGTNRILLVFEDGWTYYIHKAEVCILKAQAPGAHVPCLQLKQTKDAQTKPLPEKTGETAALPETLPAVDENLLVLVSDVHIHKELVEGGKKKLYDTVGDFKKCVADVLAMNPRPAGVVFFGDLQHIGASEEPYQLFKDLLKPWDDAKIPYYLCMGNHDQPWRFFKVFPEWLPKTQVDKALVYDVAFPSLDLIILETTDYSNGWYGKLGEKQKAWYDKRIAAQKDGRPVFVCGHHNWQLMREKPDLSNPNVQGWICGHYHDFVTNNFPDGARELRVPASGHTNSGYNGYVLMKIAPDQYTFTLKTYDAKNPDNGRQIVLKKR